MRLVCPVDVRRAPEVGDTVIAQLAGVVRPAVVLKDPESDTFGRHRLELLVFARSPFIPKEPTPPAAELTDSGWLWRAQDLAPGEISPRARVESVLEPEVDQGTPPGVVPPSVPTEFRSLWGNDDPAAWAERFMRKFGKTRQDIDEGLMLAWFSNAMQSSGGVAQGTAHDLAMALASAVDTDREFQRWSVVKQRAEAALRLYVNEMGDATLDYVKKVLDHLRSE